MSSTLENSATAGELKVCPRCQNKFLCRAENVTKCFCISLILTAEQRLKAKNQWTGCRCPDSLKLFGSSSKN